MIHLVLDKVTSNLARRFQIEYDPFSYRQCYENKTTLDKYENICFHGWLGLVSMQEKCMMEFWCEYIDIRSRCMRKG